MEIEGMTSNVDSALLCRAPSVLPCGLNAQRRAPILHRGETMSDAIPVINSEPTLKAVDRGAAIVRQPSGHRSVGQWLPIAGFAALCVSCDFFLAPAFWTVASGPPGVHASWFFARAG